MPSARSLRLTAVARAALVGAALAGCADGLMHDDLTDCPYQETKETSYIQLTIGMANAGGTRAGDPYGGEPSADKDGYEHGQQYENDVQNLAVFLFQGSLSDANKNAEVTVLTFSKEKKEFTDSAVLSNPTEALDFKDFQYTTTAKKVEAALGSYNVLVVANYRDGLQWATDEDNLTLGDVLDHIETEAWNDEGVTEKYSDFLMSSYRDVTVDLHSCTEDDPIPVSVDVQRMAARVDYKFASEHSDGKFTISSTEGEGDPNYAGSTVEITGAMLVNDLNSGSYLIKRVSPGEDGTVTYLGEETVDVDDFATNYVIDPWTEEKTGGSVEGLTYGVYYPGEAQNDQQTKEYWEERITPYDKAEPMNDNDGTTWKRIGYTMENTTYSDFTSKKYSTGAVFQATFTPAEDLVISNFDEGYEYDYDTPGTFFMYSNHLYATVEDVMMVVYPSPSTENNPPAFTSDATNGNSFDAYINSSCSTWSDVTTFAESLRDDDPTGYKKYLTEQADGKTGTETISDKSALYWAAYMKSVCGYVFSSTTHTLTLNSDFKQDNEYTTTREALAAVSDNALHTYVNGVCFYSWWIRHSNDQSEKTNGTMEYSIVRNNIYKLTLESVYSLGGDVPDEGIYIHAYVNPWTVLEPEDIKM